MINILDFIKRNLKKEKGLQGHELSENSGLTKFLMISSPRTGSNLLTGMLDAHPEIIAHYELFHKQAVYYSDKYGHEWIKDYNVEKRDKDPASFLEFIYSQRLNTKAKCIGFKIFDEHNMALLEELIADPKVKKIILKRDNLLMSFLSKLEAEKSGVFFETKDGKKAYQKPERINFNYRHFRIYEQRNLKFFDEVENKIKFHGQDYFTIEYQNILNKDVLRELLVFLGVTPDPDLLEVRFRKQNQKKLEDRLSNYEEMLSQLKEKSCEKYLEPEHIA